MLRIGPRIEAGVVTGVRKERNRGKMVTGFIMGPSAVRHCPRQPDRAIARPDFRDQLAADVQRAFEDHEPRRKAMRFHTTILQSGKTAAGIQVPTEIVEGLGAGKVPKVRVTIRGYTYRSSVAMVGGVPMVGVSAENRVAAGVAGGDEVDVDLELDTAPREVTVPPTSRLPSMPSRTHAGRLTGCLTATSRGMSARSREPRPTRHAGGVSPGPRRSSARAVPAEALAVA